jgi:hypothetical protein
MMSAELLAVIDRDHPSDVARLNAALRLSGEARLAEHVPPHTFVGDIEGVKPGDCVLFMGINPKLNFDEDFRRVNIELPSRCLSEFRRTGDRSALDDWMAFQRGYFLREERNKRHFNKIGKWLGPRWFPGTWAEFEEKEAIQMVLHRHLVEVDAVQYFSHKAAIDTNLLARLIQTDPALAANMRMIEWLIAKIQPKWIQVNGKSNWEMMECLYGEGKMKLLNSGEKPGTEIKVGYLRFGEMRIPVLMHKFLGSISGVNSNADKELVWTMWSDWLG